MGRYVWSGEETTSSDRTHHATSSSSSSFSFTQAQNIKKTLRNTFVSRVLWLIPNWFPMLVLNCMPESISHFHRFSAASSTFVHPHSSPAASYRVPQVGFPPKNPLLNINGRHSVQVRGIHANSPPGHPSTQMHQEWRRILGSIVLLWQTLLVSVPGT